MRAHVELWGRATRMAAFAVAYALAVGVGRTTQLESGEFALIWPAAPIAVLWVMYAGSSKLRPFAVLGVLVVGTIANAMTAVELQAAVFLGAASAALAVVTSELLRLRSARTTLRDPADLWTLLGAVAVGSVVGALVAASGLALLDGHDFWVRAGELTTRNFVSVAVGLATWLTLRGVRWSRPPWPVVLEAAATAAVVVLVFWLVFWANSGLPLSFLIVPLSAWVAIRFTTPSAMVYTLASGVAITAATLADRGVFTDGTPAARALLVQALVGVTLIVVLLLALYRDSRVRLIAGLDEASALLRDKAELLGAVLDSISDGVVVVDGKGERSLTNAAAVDSGVIDQLMTESPAGPRSGAATPLRRAREGVRVLSTTVRVHSGGAERVLSVNARPLRGKEASGSAVAVFRDVTEERRAQRRLRETRDLFAGVLDAASEQSIIGVDAEGWITVFNVGAERMLGYRRSEMLGRSPLELHLDEELRARAVGLGLRPGLDVLVHRARDGMTETREWTYRRKDGQTLSVSLSVSAMRDLDGYLVGFILVGTDVTQRREAERALAESEERFRLAFETAPMGMYIYGVDHQDLGRITRVNRAMTRFVGRPVEELVGTRVQTLAAADQTGSVDALLDQLSLAPGEQRSHEVAFRHADGSVVWGAVASAVVLPPGGGSPYGICLIEDVTARKEVEAELRHQALHDALTGLANRVLLVDRLELALAASGRSGRLVGMIVLDLDGFKEVNDQYGHAEGDELLCAVAARLSAAVRPGDTLARLGGDEFAVVCPDIDASIDLELMAGRLAAALREPYPLASGHTHREVSASVGVALSGDGCTPETLLQAGDQAMYAAKRHGKDRIETFDRTRDGRAARLDRLRPQLRQALERDEFVMFGQPIIDIESGQVVAVETLVRWRHPDRGLLPPSEFLHVIEGSNDMAPLGRRVLRESCRMAAQWQPPGRTVRVHVNVSGRQLESGVFRAEVESALDYASLDPSALVLELTETHTSIVPDAVIRDLGRLRDDGVGVAIDDIGTGYSSLARLTEMPVDILKIDRQFVSGIGDDSRCEAVVRGVLGIGRALGLDVVAEGIEQPSQLHRLRDWGCQMAQGYLTGWPVPEGDLDVDGHAAVENVVSFPSQHSGRDGLG